MYISMKDLVVYKVNISHYRLVELSALADQAKPFYDWAEKKAKEITSSHKNLSDIFLSATKAQISEVIRACYNEEPSKRPLLFDGIGRVYPHPKACFFFFAWIVRDAPQQRLAPLISRMRKATKVSEFDAQLETLASLIYEYRTVVKSFDWQVVREIVIDRLEGSRRSIKGHGLETKVRTALVTAIQNFYSIKGDYGNFREVRIADKQIKLGNHTVDVSAELIADNKKNNIRLLLPIKTRETEGGGHSHIFSRDLIAAIRDIKESEGDSARIVVIIIAENWSPAELGNIKDRIDLVFHFDMSPIKFEGFDDKSQIELNKLFQEIMGDKKK